MKILFLIDPNSIHDIKWVKYFSLQSTYKCYFICREHHYSMQIVEEINENFGIIFLGNVKYFSISKPLNTIKQSLFIKNLIKKYNIDLFHIQYAEPNALWTLLKPIIKVPIIITCRGTDVLKTIPEHFAKKDLLNQIVKCLYKLAFIKSDWITVTSQRQMESIKKFSGRQKNISIIRTGVAIDEIKKDNSQFFRKEITKSFILFPRYIKPLYNHEFCLKAVEKLPKRIKDGYQMVFIGKDSGDISYQRSLIEMMSLSKSVEYIFLPKLQQKEISELYKRASLIVMTPLSDGSPVSAMEALILNKNVILGPLEYDKDIFDNPLIHKMNSWHIDELIDKIERCLFIKNKVKLDERITSLLDSSKNMRKLEYIYYRLKASE
ncbi:glycosyltransferase family 4 protein [Marivirga sp. S37H4]|uniref:Glycosyltransferase family 4 protein n=1 Tax=Marivirga aurantiaca TaxID=2802615 RepID=A0A935CBV2_9BACT|nr:glycosyltransferase [Marivirga aurantiaca]MBK6267012.1 glycosyltransferase family 4 protein [Marivirga aurantiaca]